jgi:hypothetical protein
MSQQFHDAHLNQEHTGRRPQRALVGLGEHPGPAEGLAQCVPGAPERRCRIVSQVVRGPVRGGQALDPRDEDQMAVTRWPTTARTSRPWHGVAPDHWPGWTPETMVSVADSAWSKSASTS